MLQRPLEPGLTAGVGMMHQPLAGIGLCAPCVELRRNAATRGGRLEYRATTAQCIRIGVPAVRSAKLAENDALRHYVQATMCRIVWVGRLPARMASWCRDPRCVKRQIGPRRRATSQKTGPLRKLFDTRQPTTNREYASITNATYAKPDQVRT